MKLIHGDCLEVLQKLISDGITVDAIICDLPYGTTQCKWDSIIPFAPLWALLNQIIKDNGAIVLHASQPFTTKLIASNMKMFKYCWVWDKTRTTNFLNAKRQPLRRTEDIVVFYKKQCTYNPQKTTGHKPLNSYTHHTFTEGLGKTTNYSGGGQTDRHPTNIINIPQINNDGTMDIKYHPTQKPVALMEYIIRTYTNEYDTVLDFTCGSGSTMVACKNLNRHGIGIDNGYCIKDKIVNGVQIKNKSWIEITQLRLRHIEDK